MTLELPPYDDRVLTTEEARTFVETLEHKLTIRPNQENYYIICTREYSTMSEYISLALALGWEEKDFLQIIPIPNLGVGQIFFYQSIYHSASKSANPPMGFVFGSKPERSD